MIRIIEREHGMYCLHKFVSCIFRFSSHVLPTNYDSRIFRVIIGRLLVNVLYFRLNSQCNRMLTSIPEDVDSTNQKQLKWHLLLLSFISASEVLTYPVTSFPLNFFNR